MKRHSAIYLIICLLICNLTGCINTGPSPSKRSAQNKVSNITGNLQSKFFDSDWRFIRADAKGAEEPGFDDTAWRTLDLPHDWSIEDLPQETNSSSAAPVPSNSPAGGRRGRG